MEGMITTARRHAGQWSFAFQNLLMKWLIQEVQPRLDRLADLESQMEKPKTSARKSRTTVADLVEPGGDA